LANIKGKYQAQPKLSQDQAKPILSQAQSSQASKFPT
jgi:hypothetical protein